MHRAFHARPMRVLYIVLAIALSFAGAAPPAPPAPIGDLTDQRRALYQSELEQNLLLRAGLGYEHAGRVLGWTLARGHHSDATPQGQAAQAGQPSDAVKRFRHGERASQEQNITDDATQQKLAERWNYYYQATRMSLAELRAWLQAQQRADTGSPPAAQAPGPARPAQPTTQPGWLVVSLGVVAAVLVLVAGLAMLVARRATRRARVGQAT
jgi:hypothetical protein